MNQLIISVQQLAVKFQLVPPPPGARVCVLVCVCVCVLLLAVDVEHFCRPSLFATGQDFLQHMKKHERRSRWIVACNSERETSRLGLGLLSVG